LGANQCPLTVFARADWSSERLHCFRIQGKDYGIAYLGGISFEDNPHKILLSRFRLHPRESFRYQYDFTANWQVDIRLEEILPQQRRCALPVCTGERGAAPGEEYAGALEYLQRLDRHRYEFPFEELGTMARALRRVGWMPERTVSRSETGKNSGRRSSA
jgi:hypothetical protein